MWEETSTYLRRGEGDDRDAPAERRRRSSVAAGQRRPWRLPGDLGRRYAAVSGDHNPIHLYPLTAKAFGFPRQIAHGMWSKARCVAALENRLPDAVTVEVAFKKPIFLPGTVAFGSRAVRRRARLRPHLTEDGAPAPGRPHPLGPSLRTSRPQRVRRRIRPSWATVATSRPSWVKTRASDSPRPPQADGRPLVVEPPLVGAERPVEPDRVVERGRPARPGEPIVDAVRHQRRAEQGQVAGVGERRRCAASGRRRASPLTRIHSRARAGVLVLGESVCPGPELPR